MSKSSDNIGFDACLVFVQHQTPSFNWAVFATLTSIITTFFDCKAMTPYTHAFMIVGGFLCWEEIKLVIFTVDHEVAPLACAKKA